MDANNVAYTTEKLSFHTDYPVLQFPPGVRESKREGNGARQEGSTVPVKLSNIQCRCLVRHESR